jgi:hypothetical protein
MKLQTKLLHLETYSKVHPRVNLSLETFSELKLHKELLHLWGAVVHQSFVNEDSKIFSFLRARTFTAKYEIWH